MFLNHCFSRTQTEGVVVDEVSSQTFISILLGAGRARFNSASPSSPSERSPVVSPTIVPVATPVAPPLSVPVVSPASPSASPMRNPIVSPNVPDIVAFDIDLSTFSTAPLNIGIRSGSIADNGFTAVELQVARDSVSEQLLGQLILSDNIPSDITLSDLGNGEYLFSSTEDTAAARVASLTAVLADGAILFQANNAVDGSFPEGLTATLVTLTTQGTYHLKSTDSIWFSQRRFSCCI